MKEMEGKRKGNKKKTGAANRRPEVFPEAESAGGVAGWYCCRAGACCLEHEAWSNGERKEERRK